MAPLDSPTAPTDEPDLTGRCLGDFQLLRRLGRGGMAVVYLAEQKSLQRPVALKVLRSSLVSDRQYVERFRREALAAAKLAHPHIVQIYDVGSEDGFHYIAQEYVAGPNLKQYLARHGALAPAQAIAIIAQVASALRVAAERGIVHRDIKPENTMLTTDGQVKVADFGLARIMDDRRQVELTQDGITLGTPLYMSPEQIEGKPLDPRSDLYSLGIMAYQILAGCPPFEGDSPLSLAVQHLQKKPKPLESVRSDIPLGLCRIVERLLGKKPEDRFQSADELLEALHKVAQPVDAASEEGTPSSTGLLPIPESWALPNLPGTDRLSEVMAAETRMMRRHRQALRVIPLAVAAALLGGFGAYWFRPKPITGSAEATYAIVARQPDAQQQYYHALLQNTEAGYLAVMRYFPPSVDHPTHEYYARLATQKLGELYLEQGRFKDAQRVFKQLADLGAESPEFAVIGFFGMASAYEQAGRTTDAESMLARAAPLWDRLDRTTQSALRRYLGPGLQQRFERIRKLRSEVPPRETG